MRLFGRDVAIQRVPLDRIEAAYLTALRIAVLAVATICLVAAVWFAGDAAWRLFVSTDVTEEPTIVAPAEVAAATRQVERQANSGEGDDIPPYVRDRHEAFARDVFSRYYAIYKRASDAYKKDEDELLSQTELIEALGYDLDTYASGESFTAKRFVEDAAYQNQAIAAVTAAMADPAMVRLLQVYKAAEKTERSCSTTYERRRVADVCYDWYYGAYSCTSTRSVPVERCVAVYPDGIVSPLVAFGRADEAFQLLWEERATANAAEAQRIRGERYAARAMIGPKIMLAFWIAGGFLIVMFFFLIIAIERHLRRLSVVAPSVASAEVKDA